MLNPTEAQPGNVNFVQQQILWSDAEQSTSCRLKFIRGCEALELFSVKGRRQTS